MPADHISRYEVKSELGRGGMATVFHAYDPNFERDVAIKVLPEVFLHDPQFRVRFEREAKTIASLEHPAIVPVYDFGESDGLPFIVMRYMSGGTLTDRVSQGPLSVVDTSRIISRLAPALDAAHARGIIHRDIKPGNILFDQYGNSFLSDFGIAHLESTGTLTGGHTLGTPSYMSPEQVQGDKSLDGRSDIYALGVLAYQMLTGQLPYSADTPAKVMMMHVLQPVPHIMDARGDLPSGCDMIISKTMAKDREERFPTSGEFAAALEAIASTSGSYSTQGYTPTTYPSSEAEILTSISRAPLSDQLTMKQAAAAAQATAVISPTEKKRSPIMAIVMGVLVIIILSVVGLYFMGARGQGPFASLAPAPTNTATLPPTETSLPPTLTFTPEVIIVIAATDAPESTRTLTLTVAPTDTPTLIPAGPVIGGADKVAYVSGKNIFTANLDGSDSQKLTEDGAAKWNLQWSMDGKFLHYISGKCIFNLEFETGKINMINCFNFADSIKAFQTSPDDTQVAITLDNNLFMVPYDIDALSQVRSREDLTELADCEAFAPYTRNLVESAQWSKDGKQMALMTLVPVPGGKQGNVIQIVDIDKCVPNPHIVDNFPPPRFTMKRYEQDPRFQNFGYNGETLFTINTNERNDGYGDLFGYASNQFKVYPNINPINGLCCYRDSQFSPDGQYLVFVFQDRLQGALSASQIYLIRYGDIGTGATFSPIPLPEITDPKEKPQPALRPAQ